MTHTEPRKKTWTITWNGKTYSEADITGGHFAILVMLTGRDDISMLDLDPLVYDESGAVSDVHGMVLMMLIQMFLSADLAEAADTGTGEDVDEVTRVVATCIAQAVNEVRSASMADVILPALSFGE